MAFRTGRNKATPLLLLHKLELALRSVREIAEAQGVQVTPGLRAQVMRIGRQGQVEGHNQDQVDGLAAAALAATRILVPLRARLVQSLPLNLRIGGGTSQMSQGTSRTVMARKGEVQEIQYCLLLVSKKAQHPLKRRCLQEVQAAQAGMLLPSKHQPPARQVLHQGLQLVLPPLFLLDHHLIPRVCQVQAQNLVLQVSKQ